MFSKHKFYVTKHFTQVLAIPTDDDFIMLNFFLLINSNYLRKFAIGNNATNNIINNFLAEIIKCR